MKRANGMYVPYSAQGVQCGEKPASCGSACGSGDPQPKPSACGSADPEPKPAACGSACGAGGK